MIQLKTWKPPEQNLSEMSNKHYKRWLIQAPVGLATIGFGACLIAEAAIEKYSHPDEWSWVIYGTIALVVFNAGMSIFGDAILHRSRYERERENKNE